MSIIPNGRFYVEQEIEDSAEVMQLGVQMDTNPRNIHINVIIRDIAKEKNIEFK